MFHAHLVFEVCDLYKYWQHEVARLPQSGWAVLLFGKKIENSGKTLRKFGESCENLGKVEKALEKLRKF